MGKQPKARSNPQFEKRPRLEADPAGYHRVSPSWRIRKLELIEPFGWHLVDKLTLADIRTKLGDLESMRWGDILNSHQHHNIPVGKLCPEARARLAAIRQDDVEELLSLRLSGKQRVWGILAEGVCTLLWWDPEHRVCPSIKS